MSHSHSSQHAATKRHGHLRLLQHGLLHRRLLGVCSDRGLQIRSCLAATNIRGGVWIDLPVVPYHALDHVCEWTYVFDRVIDQGIIEYDAAVLNRAEWSR